MEQSEKKDIIVELNSDLSTVTLNGYRLSTWRDCQNSSKNDQ